MKRLTDQIGNLEWKPEQIEAFEAALANRPHFERLNHVSINVDDLQVAKKFYADVLGGRVIGESAHFVLVAIAGTVIGMSDVNGKAPYTSSPDAEFPHIAFEVTSEQFLPMKAWLEAHGVRTHRPWTRYQTEGLMYFKDPFRNLIEMYCPSFDGAKELANTRDVREVVSFAELEYRWDPSSAKPILPASMMPSKG